MDQLNLSDEISLIAKIQALPVFLEVVAEPYLAPRPSVVLKPISLLGRVRNPLFLKPKHQQKLVPKKFHKF